MNNLKLLGNLRCILDYPKKSLHGRDLFEGIDLTTLLTL